MSLSVSIVSAEGEIFSGSTELLVATSLGGEVGIYKNHTPLLCVLKPGQVRLCEKENNRFFYISGGFLEVQPSLATILADTAIRAEDLDEARAQQAHDKAREELRAKQSEQEYAQTLTTLAKVSAQLEIIRRLRK